MTSVTQTTVLYAEDDENDAFFMERAFSKMNLRETLRVVRTGQMAIDYLEGVGEFGERSKHPLPDLLLLDVKMPEKSGLEVLSWLRKKPEFAALTVAMFTSSTQESDIKHCLANGANGYFVKPSRADTLSNIVKAILSARCIDENGTRRLDVPENQLLNRAA